MEKQFTTFYLGEDRFGIDILLVKEINRHLEMTDVAGTPEFIRGLLNLRGQIVTVMDLPIRLGREACKINPETRCIILKTDAELAPYHAANILKDTTGKDVVGLLVDKIGDMITVDDADIDPAPANISGVDSKLLSGVIRHEDELVVTICAQEILVQ